MSENGANKGERGGEGERGSGGGRRTSAGRREGSHAELGQVSVSLCTREGGRRGGRGGQGGGQEGGGGALLGRPPAEVSDR